MIVWRNGKSAAYQPLNDKKIFGQNLVLIIKKDKQFIPKLCRTLKTKTDKFLRLAKKSLKKDVDFKKYLSIQAALLDYYIFHIELKVLVDYLPPKLLKKYFRQLEQARVYAEPVFKLSEEYMRALAEIHTRKTKYPAHYILSMLNNEFDYYLQNGKLPPLSKLKQRYRATAILCNKSTVTTLIGNDVDRIEKILHSKTEKNIIKGATAYPGIVQGKVKIVPDPRQAGKFNKGDILVAGMTRPDYLPLMKKAAAFITDGGGMLCHAAIIARELKKPCVIGTQNATKKLKNGMRVKIHASSQGLINIINA